MGGRHTWPTQLGSAPTPLPDHAGSIPVVVSLCITSVWRVTQRSLTQKADQLTHPHCSGTKCWPWPPVMSTHEQWLAVSQIEFLPKSTSGSLVYKDTQIRSEDSVFTDKYKMKHISTILAYIVNLSQFARGPVTATHKELFLKKKTFAFVIIKGLEKKEARQRYLMSKTLSMILTILLSIISQLGYSSLQLTRQKVLFRIIMLNIHFGNCFRFGQSCIKVVSQVVW